MCPLFPLLFVLALEPLAEAVRRAEGIHGIEVAGMMHNIPLNADDIVLFITEPEDAMRNLLKLIKEFSFFSSYRINWNKTERYLRFNTGPLDCFTKYVY